MEINAYNRAWRRPNGDSYCALKEVGIPDFFAQKITSSQSVHSIAVFTLRHDGFQRLKIVQKCLKNVHS
jgi:hypothetical protein